MVVLIKPFHMNAPHLSLKGLLPCGDFIISSFGDCINFFLHTLRKLTFNIILKNLLSFSGSIANYSRLIFINNIAEADCNSQRSHWSFCKENHPAKINCNHFQNDLDSQKIISVHHKNICTKFIYLNELISIYNCSVSTSSNNHHARSSPSFRIADTIFQDCIFKKHGIVVFTFVWIEA